MKINILGTEYTIIEDVDPEDMPKDSHGCMDYSNHSIKVAKLERDEDSIQDLETYRRKILRHEIIHAFLYESGLHVNSNSCEDWATNEEMVDWIAIQAPKLIEAFKTAGCWEG